MIYLSQMTRTLSLFILLLPLTLTAAEKVYVPFFSSENVSRQTAMSSTFMLVDYINEGEAFEAIAAEKRDTVKFEVSNSEIKESAELLGSSYYTMGRIIRLGEIYHVSLKLYTTSSSLLVWDATRTAHELSEFPMVLKELAAHLGSKKKFSQAGDLYLLPKSSSERTTRIKSNKAIGLITGAMMPMDGEIDQLNGGVGFMGSFDSRSYIIQMTGEVYYGNDSVTSVHPVGTYENRYFNAGINVLYPLNSTNNAPFVCLGSAFTYRDTKVNVPGPPTSRPGNSREFSIIDTGMFLSGGGGYLLKRNSDASLFIYGRGYAYVPAVDQITFGAMLNLALTVGW